MADSEEERPEERMYIQYNKTELDGTGFRVPDS